MKVDLLLYDLDGTLIDSVQDITDSVNVMLSEMGHPTRSQEEIKQFVGEGIQNLVARSIASEDVALQKQALKIVKRCYTERLLNHTKLYSGVLELLMYFRAKKQAVVTNKPLAFSIQILEALNAYSFFTHVLGGDSGFPKKPEPNSVLHIMEALDIERDRTLMVGDSIVDIETAKNAGIKICAVTYGLGDRQAIEAARPDFLINRIGELKNIAT